MSSENVFGGGDRNATRGDRVERFARIG